MLDLGRLKRSFGYAGRGLSRAFREEMSFRVQLAVALVVLILMFIFPLRVTEKLFLVMGIVSVLVLELINSILERLVDVYKPRLDPYVQDIKDMMAAAVLVASLGSLIVGLVIFVPYLKNIWS
jgi:diacylglycerol kinase